MYAAAPLEKTLINDNSHYAMYSAGYSHLVLKAILQGRYYYYPNFIDKTVLESLSNLPQILQLASQGQSRLEPRSF